VGEAERWRTQLVDGLGIAMSVLGGLGLPLILFEFGSEYAGLAVATMSVWAVLVVAMLLRRRIPVGARAAIVLTVFYVGMVLGLGMVGPLFGPALSGALVVVAAGLVLGRRAGFVALGVVALTILGTGALVAVGWLPAPDPALRSMDGFGSWVREAAAFAVFTGVIMVSIAFVVGRIERSLASASDALARVEAEAEARVEAQAALAESEKAVSELQRLEALGHLAGGVAHDFNNALMVLMGGADMLAEADLDAEQRQVLADMSQAMDGAAQLTAQLLAFGRRDVVAPRHLDIAEVVATTARSLRRVLPDDIELRQVIETPPAIVAGEAQIQQILLNLVINARDAMPAGGVLTLTARGETDTDGRRWLLLEVHDTGHGMDAATRERVFEPFFTTKPQHEGTGLGLSTVHTLVQRMEGSIEVHSEPGAGAVFRIRVPAAELLADAAAGATSATRAESGRGTVLLAEDDDSVRHVMVWALSQAGFQVIEAADTPQALALVEQHGPGIDLLCTDGVMPGGSCKAVIDSYRARAPGAPVLVCSGYVQEDLVRRDIAAGTVEYLPKPFQSSTLVARVTELLQG
jgi:signal transduction histidine kinase/CheY-like chemotaxis protein